MGSGQAYHRCLEVCQLKMMAGVRHFSFQRMVGKEGREGTTTPPSACQFPVRRERLDSFRPTG